MVRHKLVRIEIQVAITFIYLFYYYYYKQNKQKTQLRNVNFGAKKVWIRIFKKQNKVKCNLAIARYEFTILREKGWAVVI